jgi:prolyl oligopeptidase
MVREGTAAPRLLLDPDALATRTGSKAHLAISTVLPSPDGAYVAVGIVPGGAEPQTHTRIVNVADGSLLVEDFPRTWGGPTAWGPDGKTLFYNQLAELKPGESENDRELNSKAYRHTIGSSGPDQPIFGIGLDPNVPMVPIDQPSIVISPASEYAVGVVQASVQNELTLYVAPVGAVLSASTIPWRKVADVDDAVTSFDLKDSTMYLLTHKNALRYKVDAIDLSRTDQTASNATAVVPPSGVVIQQIAVAQDGLYIRGILGGLANLRKLPYDATGGTGALTEVKLPFIGTLEEFTVWSKAPGAVIGLDSWTKPERVYSLDAGGALTDTMIAKPPDYDVSRYTSIEVEAKSEDGTMIPLSIVMLSGTKLDGSNPVYLQAYGAYGFDIDPGFLGRGLAWLDQGGIWAVAHVRGGGEYGEEWHLAGKGGTKHHTFEDAVGAARYLIAKGYTSPSHLAIEGTSAGGIMVGGAITRHPELFAAALDVVGWTDILRSEAADPNGVPNVPEFGSVKTEPGYNALYVMDAYQHITDGKAYPAVMAITGINDPRVAPWHPAKFVARLQQASTSGRPVLLRVDYDAGHGGLGASDAQLQSLFTDEFSFLLWQCGSPLFAGIPTHIVTR